MKGIGVRSIKFWMTPFGVIVVSFLFALTAATLSQRAISAEDTERVSEVCLDCHDEAPTGLLGTPHQILEGADDADARVACTDCHLGDKNHYEDDPEDFPMVNPTEASVTMVAQICATCHVNSHQQNMGERNPHFENDVNCTGCHQVHGGQRARLLKEKEPELCYECHMAVRGEFAQPYRHPVSDGIIRCSECHMVVDEDKRTLSVSRMDAVCFQCHEYFQGPFPFEHQAAVGYSTEEGGCLTCHRAHGSNVPRMLNRPYEPPNYNLCSQCHVVPKHNNNAMHDDRWAGVPCNECHGDIHGSYVSQYFFDPSLEARGCINPMCHRL